MKKIIIILALAFISCNEKPQVAYEQKYSYGTVMYVKPDSLKVLIVKFDKNDGAYKVSWRDKTGNTTNGWYSEEGFYGEVIQSKDSIY